jgi:hypothetical protein
MMEDEATLRVRCDTHGEMDARYLVCCQCHALCDLEGDDIPETCACGAPFLPSIDPENFTARLICTPCAVTLQSGAAEA